MSDKITNFEDYKKKDLKPDYEKRDSLDNESSEGTVGQETTDIRGIQIEDPLQFFNETEREEYFRERQKTEKKSGGVKTQTQKRIESSRSEKNKEELYEDNYDDDYYEDDVDDESGINMELVVRIASVLTGIIILACLAMIFKARVYDVYLAPDPDDTEVVVSAIPSGYTEKNDTVVVTAENLNLRTVPSTDSDTYIAVKVTKDTELKRIALSNDGTWALVEYEGQQLYGYMKYLAQK